MRRRDRFQFPQRGRLADSRTLDLLRGGAPFRGCRRLNVEHLEQRLLMTVCDAPCFIHDPPEPLPVPGVGQAGLLANNDQASAMVGDPSRMIDVLGNDELPGGVQSARITEVSPSTLGGQVEIFTDGRFLVYTPPAEGTGKDSFFYIVEDDAGNRGQANVVVWVEPRLLGPQSDSFHVLEDAVNTRFDVLQNDRDFAAGTIVAISEPSGGGTVRIADDGRSVIYSTTAGQRGSDSFSYTVEDADGNQRAASVYVHVSARFDPRHDNPSIDVDTAETVIDVLANDLENQVPLPPHIIDVSSPHFGGTIRISADGTRLLYRPAAGFQGGEAFTYTVRYGPLDHHVATGSVTVSVVDPYLAVDNWFAVAPDSAGVALDVLANDPILAPSNLTVSQRALQIVDVGPGSHGGKIRVSDDGLQVLYTPAAGFVGQETFEYTVVDNTGHRDTAVVTVDVAPPVVDPFNLPRFASRAELEQYLLDEAVEWFGRQFGNHMRSRMVEYINTGSNGNGDIIRATDTHALNDHSDTNTQHAGIDEADIVETDGDYVYILDDGRLSIVDVRVVSRPTLVSITKLEDNVTEMYLNGDRLVLLERGLYSSSGTAAVLEIDVSRRDQPQVLRRTEFDGRIVDSRVIDQRVHLVLSRPLILPSVTTEVLSQSDWQDDPHDPRRRVRTVDSRYETLDEYVARVGGSLTEATLPMFRTYDGQGTLIETGLINDAQQIHQPVDFADDHLLSIVSFDLADDTAERVASVGIFTDNAQRIYVSPSGVYVMRTVSQQTGDWNAWTQETGILKFALPAAGAAHLEAVGQVPGTVLNQFSADEHEGRLRIVTNEVVWRGFGRQQRMHNNLFVLEQTGTTLQVVGSLVHLAPTEHVRSVRFLGDRAYVVTFRQVDPVLAIDLSDPTAPQLRGELHIPGFSDYLHPVGEDYLIGIGHDADPVTGAVQAPQVSLFYVGDLNQPLLVDRMTLTGTVWAASEVSRDHHAVSYFPKQQVLSIPVSWRTSTDLYETHSAAWIFRLDVDGATGSLDFTGRIDHEAEMRRSVRIGSALLTVSADDVKVHDINHPEVPLGGVRIGKTPRDDSFVLQEGESQRLDVLANDHAGADGVVPHIIAVSNPPASWRVHPYLDAALTTPPATVEIVDGGRALRFTPRPDFFGIVNFTYTVFDSLRGEQTARVTVSVLNVPDDPVATDDQFSVQPDSIDNVLDVLANDFDPDAPSGPIFMSADLTLQQWLGSAPLLNIVGRFENQDRDHPPGPPVTRLQPHGLTISTIGLADNGGMVSLSEDGLQLIYTPAAGFQGIETFTYTITSRSGRTAVATVSVIVGSVPISVPAPSPDGAGEPAGSDAPQRAEPIVDEPVDDQPAQRAAADIAPLETPEPTPVAPPAVAAEVTQPTTVNRARSAVRSQRVERSTPPSSLISSETTTIRSSRDNISPDISPGLSARLSARPASPSSFGLPQAAPAADSATTRVIQSAGESLDRGASQTAKAVAFDLFAVSDSTGSQDRPVSSDLAADLLVSDADVRELIPDWIRTYGSI